MLLMHDSAARVQEMLGIRLKDIKLGTTPTVTLSGKGKKIRTVPLMRQTVEYCLRYLDILHPGEPEYFGQFLFFTLMHEVKKPMNSSTVRRIMSSYGASAKEGSAEIPDGVHPHLFLHSRAMHLYQHGMDLSLILSVAETCSFGNNAYLCPCGHRTKTQGD